MAKVQQTKHLTLIRLAKMLDGDAALQKKFASRNLQEGRKLAEKLTGAFFSVDCLQTVLGEAGITASGTRGPQKSRISAVRDQLRQALERIDDLETEVKRMHTLQSAALARIGVLERNSKNATSSVTTTPYGSNQ